MKEKKVYQFTLEEVSVIVAEHIKNETGYSFYTGIKVMHDDKGKIYFEFRY